MMQALAIHHTAREKVAVAATMLPALAPDQVLIRTRYSALSAGTESLIFRGHFPAGLKQDDTLASLSRTFEYPFAYGYALVGEVIDVGAQVDSSLRGKVVFAFHPHQDHAVVAARDVIPIPAEIDPVAALFLPNMESAINFVIDANPRIGERVIVFGLGVLGLLTVALLAEFPLVLLVGADPIATRRGRAVELGCGRTVDPSDVGDWRALKSEIGGSQPSGIDVAIELSGNTRALEQAIEVSGFGGRIVIGSWYGAHAKLGGLDTHFHRSRIEMSSSQVSTIDPKLSARWTKSRRIELACSAIARLRPERLITHRFAFADCQRAFDLASRREDGVLQIVFEYTVGRGH
jgi:2-desacetyl-2-hydroxyethyl bacteriochlorophyllide A dehydrogenase